MGTTTLDPFTPDCAPEAPALATVTCLLVLSPLPGRDGRLRTRCEQFPAGDPLEAYLPEGEALARVCINGGVIAPEHYALVIPRAGDEIWLWPEWGVVGSLVGALISIAAGIALSVAAHYLFRPKPLLLPQQPQMTGETERTFSFEGIRTAIGPGGVVPVVYGRHRIGGQLLLATVDHVATVMDDGLSAPGVAIVHVSHGEPADIVFVTAPGHGFATDQTILIEGVQGKTAVNRQWTIAVADNDTFVLKFSWGVGFDQPYLGGGTARLQNVGARSYQAVTNPPTLSLMLALCEGPIDAILTDTIQINGQPLANFPGVQVYTGLGEANQPAIAEFGGARNTFSDGRELQVETPLTYTSNGILHAFTLNFTFAEGLYFLDAKGEKNSNAVTLRYRYALTGTGAWSAWSQFQVGADRTATVRIGIRREGLALAQYDIQMEFIHVINNDELRSRYRPTLESVTEHLPETYAYPHTVMLGLRAVATDALRGALPNITVEVRGRRVRVGTLAPVETWSDNPAWCMMDALTNARYGRGVPDSEIDLTSFAVFAAYCAEGIAGEARHTLNYVLDRETRAQQFFLETMGGSRGLLLKAAGQWQARPTRPETPTCLLSWASVSNVQLTYLRDADNINVLEARFANEDQDYEQDVQTWPTIDQWPPEIHKQSLDLRGITKPSRVQRALQFELNRRRYENVQLQMDCSPEALPMQLHDLFRFAHPLPGWGVSGRIQPGSTNAILQVDEDCVIESGLFYCVYVRHEDDTIEMRNLVNIVVGSVRTLYLQTVLNQAPVPRTSTWVFGRLAPDFVTDASTRTFRVTNLHRRSDTTVHVEAIIHNPAIYDEPTATPLPIITTLFNPLGPPPPLTTLVATEATRVQASGASLRVVNLSWDVAELSSAYAPYAGATILRRTVLVSGTMGQAQAGAIAFGDISDPNDPNTNYIQLTQVRGHVLDWDDYTVVSGATYQYRVIAISSLGVPNNAGSREVLIHVAGPTTPGYYPGTVRNLRLKGQPVGATVWEGRDVHVEWDRVADSPLFSETFFVQEYIVQVWAPGQVYLLRSFSVPLQPVGQSAQFTYTRAQNEEDQIHAGFAGARRDLQIMVWARTNTGAESLQPAVIVVTNPPPDMSVIDLDVTALATSVAIKWNQWREPRDFLRYELYLDTVDPPIAIYQSVSGLTDTAGIQGLTAGVTYYVYVLPYDTFGPGIPTFTESFVPFGFDLTLLEKDPPGVPTGLTLTTGTDVSQDGTIVPWVQAQWNHNPEADLRGYQLSFRIEPSNGGAPTVVHAAAGDTRYRMNVPGALTIFCKIAAEDRLSNISAYSAEVQITSGRDTVAPGPCSNLTIIGSTQKVHLLWTPSINAPDYAYAEVFASATNNLANGGLVGQGQFSYEHAGFAANQTVYFWVRAVDTSGNKSTFFPASPTGGVPGTAGQLDTTYISSLAADKILAGTITALVKIGVSGLIDLNGPSQLISIRESFSGNVRVLMGRLGSLGTDWGLLVLDAAGHIMFDARDSGVTAFGIKTGAIQAGHITTTTAVITAAAQIAFAIITDAHITNLSASKIQAGTVAAQVFWGTAANGIGTHVVIDGVNHNIVIYDAVGQLRVVMGNYAGNYGFYAFAPDGALMWDSINGATTRGIGNDTVTTVKIVNETITTIKVADNAITESVQFSDVSTLTVGASETVAATITFSVLEPGDQVILTAMTTGAVTVPESDTLVVRIRGAGLAGPELGYCHMTGAESVPMATQGVHTASITSAATFVMTLMNSTAGSAVSVHHTKLIGLRRKK